MEKFKKDEICYMQTAEWYELKPFYFYGDLSNPKQPELCIVSSGSEGTGVFYVVSINDLQREPKELKEAIKLKEDIYNLQMKLNKFHEKNPKLKDFI
jgi:hypothetical protein